MYYIYISLYIYIYLFIFMFIYVCTRLGYVTIPIWKSGRPQNLVYLFGRPA